MKQLTVISGKGGTGKTSFVACFAALSAQKVVLVDGDVDAANLSLITGPSQLEKHDFKVSRVADIHPEKCSECDLCRQLCRFEAISEEYVVDPISCEGCAFCVYACPEEAIVMEDELSGQWFVSETAYGPLVHARLGIAAENSGKLVTMIRNKGGELAIDGGKEHLLIDGPPGIGCPVIASLSGVDGALVVTEPTVSGIHDLKRILDVCIHFGVPASVCINRYDLSEEQTGKIEAYCQRNNIEMVGKIPFDRVFVDAMVQGVPVVEYTDGPLSRKISALWEKVSRF